MRGCVGDSLQITCPRRNKHPFASYVDSSHPKEVLRYRAVGARLPQTALSLCVAGSFWRRRAYASIANGVRRCLGAPRLRMASSFRARVRSVGASDPRKRSPSWPLAYGECPRRPRYLLAAADRPVTRQGSLG